jgi:glycosyltransferase involved in cell wall biosynthesis
VDLVINGRFLSQRATGVQRVAREVTGAIDRLLDEGRYPGVRARLVVQADADPAPLGLRRIEVEVARGAQGHAWEQAILPRRLRGGILLCLGNSAPLATLLSARPPAVVLHDQAYQRFPADYSRAYRWAHRVIEAGVIARAGPLLLVSESEREALGARYRVAAARAVVAPNGSWVADDVPARAPRHIPSAPRYGLFIGRPNMRKNIAGVLSTAIGLARERAQPFRFAGPGADDLAVQIPADVRGLIRLDGYVADSALPALYAGAAYLLYPSFYEASGLPPSEAMTFGCPVVAADLPVLRERCGDAAEYCDPACRNSIRAAVLAILDVPGHAAALTDKGYARAASLTWRHQAEIIIEALLSRESGPNQK